MEKLLSFTVVYLPTGMGLKKDAEVLQSALMQLGYSCRVRTASRYDRIIYGIFLKFNLVWFVQLGKKALQKIFKRRSRTVALHLESISSQAVLAADINIFIPNQEWCSRQQLSLVPQMDSLWCKSRLAENIFSQLYYKTAYMGFCTEFEPVELKESNDAHGLAFFTRIGLSHNRGALQLATLWSRHPEWPILKMVVSHAFQPPVAADNIDYIDHLPSLADFQYLAASTPCHIFLTEAEGFGHLIVESMSRGALVLMTDAAPMNEYADNHSAIMLQAKYAGQLRLSPRFCIDDAVVERAVEQVIAMPEEEKNRLIHNAKAVNEKLRKRFYSNLQQLILQL